MCKQCIKARQQLFNIRSCPRSQSSTHSVKLPDDIEESDDDVFFSNFESFDDEKDIIHNRLHALHIPKKNKQSSWRQTKLNNIIKKAAECRQSSSANRKQVDGHATRHRVGWKSPGVTGLAIVPDLSEYYDYETALEYGLFGTLDDEHCDGGCNMH